MNNSRFFITTKRHTKTIALTMMWTVIFILGIDLIMMLVDIFVLGDSLESTGSVNGMDSILLVALFIMGITCFPNWLKPEWRTEFPGRRNSYQCFHRFL